MNKNKQGKIIALVVGVIFIYTAIGYIVSAGKQVQQLKQEVKHLEYAIDDVSQQLQKLNERDRIVSESKYGVTKIVKGELTVGSVNVELTSNKLGSYEDLMILHRTSYDHTKPQTYNYADEAWEETDVINDKGNYSAEIILPFSCDYELKLAFTDNTNVNYEQLPSLDLYSKAEHVFMKDINIYKIKKNKIKFDVQVATFKSNDETELSSALCNIYYDHKMVDTIDVLKENEIVGRKEPNPQLEHLDGNYWFAIKEIEFDGIENFDESKVLIELILEDSLKNIYKMLRGVD